MAEVEQRGVLVFKTSGFPKPQEIDEKMIFECMWNLPWGRLNLEQGAEGAISFKSIDEYTPFDSRTGRSAYKETRDLDNLNDTEISDELVRLNIAIAVRAEAFRHLEIFCRGHAISMTVVSVRGA